MPASIPFVESDKGGRIEIIGGKYKGHFGWEHLTANTCAIKEWVILEAKGTNHPQEKTHCINKENVARVPEAAEPRSYEDALLEEHFDVKHDMRRLAKKLAAFASRAPGEQAIMNLFVKMWREEKRKVEKLSVVPNARAVTSWRFNQRYESMEETDEASQAVAQAVAEAHERSHQAEARAAEADERSRQAEARAKAAEAQAREALSKLQAAKAQEAEARAALETRARRAVQEAEGRVAAVERQAQEATHIAVQEAEGRVQEAEGRVAAVERQAREAVAQARAENEALTLEMTKATHRAQQAEAELAAAKTKAHEGTFELVGKTGGRQVNVVEDQDTIDAEEARIRAEKLLRLADQMSRERTSSVSPFEMSVSSSSINLPDYDDMINPQTVAQTVIAMVVDDEKEESAAKEGNAEQEGNAVQEGNAASSSPKSHAACRHQSTQSIGVVVSDDEEDQPTQRRTAPASAFGNSGVRRRRGRVSTVATQMEEVAIRASKQQ